MLSVVLVEALSRGPPLSEEVSPSLAGMVRLPTFSLQSCAISIHSVKRRCAAVRAWLSMQQWALTSNTYYLRMSMACTLFKATAAGTFLANGCESTGLAYYSEVAVAFMDTMKDLSGRTCML